MRIVCIYTEQISSSKKIADRCIKSGLKFGYKVEPYRSVFYKNVMGPIEKLGLKSKYKPRHCSISFKRKEVSITRLANGITHYMVYKECVEKNEPVCILEHDAYFVGKLPEPKEEGIIQVSSHNERDIDTAEGWRGCGRGQKMTAHEPHREVYWTEDLGVVRHPLSGLNGTSGYIIGSKAAEQMIDYIEKDGVANADRIRTEHVGEGNLWLQKPQSVWSDHGVITAHIARRDFKGHSRAHARGRRRGRRRGKEKKKRGES